MVEGRVAALIPGVQPNQTYIAADYVVAGTLPFTARVGGRADDKEEPSGPSRRCERRSGVAHWRWRS